ncbi:MAG TPA: hypothetical protein H9776_03940 [Candidatus Mediterraneibacter intestinipullorum]|nr:hypothetical protein [Candidatus Mediterraneibacter intestinipullorum]
MGIEATGDTRKIKKAYAAKLKIYHPEEYPEEFGMLNDVYGEALAYASGQINNPKPNWEKKGAWDFKCHEDQRAEERDQKEDIPYFYGELYRWIGEKDLSETELKELKTAGQWWRNQLFPTNSDLEKVCAQISEKLAEKKKRKRLIWSRVHGVMAVLVIVSMIVQHFLISWGNDSKRGAQENSDHVREYLEENYGMRVTVEKVGKRQLSSEEVIVYNAQMETGETSIEFEVWQQRFELGEKDEDGRSIYTNYLEKSRRVLYGKGGTEHHGSVWRFMGCFWCIRP